MNHMVAIGDFHSGHIYGLTPPYWMIEKHRPTQEETWFNYLNMVERRKAVAPIDILVVNGDCIDGKGTRSGSSELITADRMEQARMAQACIEVWDAKHILLTYGTGYHTGKGEDFEENIAQTVGGIIKDHHRFEVEGIVFSVKHKTGGSAIPHGRTTPLAREVLWDKLWASELEQHPRSNVLLRSHVHYHNYCGQKGHHWWLAMTLPALQGLGSKFGARQCQGTVHWGITWFILDDGGIDDWDVDMRVIHTQKDEILKF